MVDVPNNPELAAAIRTQAERLGVDPVDLGTAISYETAGSLDPWKRGPVTKYGEHRGLIQWGEPQRQRYGVTQDMPVPAQMDAVGNYLRDAGVKPGHSLLEIYSAINAGRVGRYNASDAAAGGAPGTVADKVAGMAPHRVRAELLLNGKLPAGFGVSAPERAPSQVAGAAPLSIAPAGPTEDDSQFAGVLEAAKRLAADAHEERALPSALPPLQVLSPMMGILDRRRMRG